MRRKKSSARPIITPSSAMAWRCAPYCEPMEGAERGVGLTDNPDIPIPVTETKEGHGRCRKVVPRKRTPMFWSPLSPAAIPRII